MTASPVALAFAILGLTRSPADLGYVLGADAAAQVIFLLAGVVIADRLSRRAVMLGADSWRPSAADPCDHGWSGMAGMTTISRVAIGPRKRDRSHHVRPERPLAWASPALTKVRVNQNAPPLTVPEDDISGA